MSVSKRKFHRDFKIKVCQEMESGLKTKAQVTREYELAEGLVGKWLRAYQTDPVNCFTGKGNGGWGVDPTNKLRSQIYELEWALGRKTMENEILKKSLEIVKQKKGVYPN